MASLLMTDDNRLMPGLRFHPTDVELIVDYLKPRVSNPNFEVSQFLIREFDVFSVEPWRLPADSFKYQSEQKDMHFFTPRHPTSKGSRRASRLAGSGFWQGCGKDHHIEIKTRVGGVVKTRVIGHRTQLTFMARKGTGYEKTDWIMHEFRLPCQDATKFDNLVLCRIHKKLTKRGREEITDRHFREEEEEEVVDGRVAKRRRTEKAVGNEEESECILQKPAGQEEEKELERRVIKELLQELALMEANGWTPPCGVVNAKSCLQPTLSLPASSFLQDLPCLKSLENQEAPMASNVGCVSFSPSENEEAEAEATRVNLMIVDERRLMACNDETTANDACNGVTATCEVANTEYEVVNTDSSAQNASSSVFGSSDAPNCFDDELDRISISSVTFNMDCVSFSPSEEEEADSRRMNTMREEKEEEVVEGRLGKRRRTEKDVGKEEESECILQKPAGQEEEKELERRVIKELLPELALMEANGWTPPCGVVNTESCLESTSSSPASSFLQNLSCQRSLENQEVLVPMASDVALDSSGDVLDGISLSPISELDGKSHQKIFDFSSLPPWEEVLNDLDNRRIHKKKTKRVMEEMADKDDGEKEKR